MGKVDVYIGNYLLIDEVTPEESERLASNACIVGMPVTMSYDDETETFTVSNQDGASIGIVHPKNKMALRNALENGWTCKCWLSLVYYNNDDKVFKGEIVYQFYNVKPTQTKEQQALDSFAEKTSERLASGKRPNVTLTGTGYDQVIETGDWTDTSDLPLPFSTKRGTGNVVFKRKRSTADKLALAAMANKPGCRIATYAVLLVIVLVVLFFVWRCATGA